MSWEQFTALLTALAAILAAVGGLWRQQASNHAANVERLSEIVNQVENHGVPPPTAPAAGDDSPA